MSAAAELTFDAASHTYRVGGEVWPSVTQVLEPLQFLDGVPWAVLEAARKFGNHVHEACHLWNAGCLDEAALDPHLAPYLGGWKKFLADTDSQVVFSERRLSHDALRYAGTLDAVCARTGRFHVVDIKSGVVPKTVGLQTAAYREAYRSEAAGLRLMLSPVRYCVQLTGVGSYRLHKLNDASDFNNFVSALNVHHWRTRNV